MKFSLPFFGICGKKKIRFTSVVDRHRLDANPGRYPDSTLNLGILNNRQSTKVQKRTGEFLRK